MKPVIRQILILTVVFILALFINAGAASFSDTLPSAMNDLKTLKNDKTLLMMTNIPYITRDGASALSYLEQAQEITGCKAGKGNLLFFQRPQNHPIRLMLFKKTDGRAVIISLLNKDIVSEPADLSAESISKPSFWKIAKTAFTAGPDMMTLATMANVWAKDGSYDFLKAAELHNHIWSRIRQK